MIGELNIW